VMKANQKAALSPLGERVARTGAIISRRGTGEGVVPKRRHDFC